MEMETRGWWAAARARVGSGGTAVALYKTNAKD